MDIGPSHSMKALRKFLAETYVWIVLLPVALIVLGAAMNQVAIIANHDVMPVLINSGKVMMAGGVRPFDGREMLDPMHSVMNKDTHLKFLCDILDFQDGIYSLGDEVLFLGIWMWAFAPYLWGFLICLKVYKLAV